MSVTYSDLNLITSLEPEDRNRFLDELTPAENFALLYDWRFWARPNQLPPGGDWETWLLCAGRGFGKTRSGAEWVRSEATRGGRRRLALVAPTSADARDVMVEGESGVLAVSPPGERPNYEPLKRRLTWPNGAIATVYSADEPERLRGPQHDGAWCFIAGTQIKTPAGDRPIEAIQMGDYVLTRFGARRVIQTGRRYAALARLRLSNGTELTGTLDHPVLTSNRGWVSLSALNSHDKVYLWGDDGGRWSRAIFTATKPAASYTDIGSYGNKRTALFRRAVTFITSTVLRATTASKTLRSLLRNLTKNTIRFLNVPVFASYAAANINAGFTPIIPSIVGHADGKRASVKENSSSGIALYAALNLPQDLLAIAVNDASILGVDGVVHNLTVEGAPEFFANGLLVHNCDEIASWRFADDAWANLQFGLRLGQSPRSVVTTTPKPIRIIKELLALSTTVVTKGSTFENVGNLADSFIATVRSRYEGTRLGRQELYAELLEDAEGALWKRDEIEEHRVREAPTLKRIVVACDPAATSTEEANETGIVVAGVSRDGEGYVLDDRTTRASPLKWAEAAVTAYHMFRADRLIAETNQGGEMVKTTIATVRSEGRL